ncbi:hypothetical protein CEE37_04900 [candidate division LCP-89 bacterium B3_LCP]|uniref:Right handed beta helix domain-containing protein n=1 Tax=candidate division LCP-89 bacterium B3_LCP TaxID=2012998 RepID=A0A532V1B6_UNCL8|nr:MAG: hypothetical protein CEE37_04900 [candidate division LCP-89 bacterium B3_LCP]
MDRKFALIVIWCIITSLGICQSYLVDGYCYLENQIDHSGTKVLFEATSVTPDSLSDSTYTDASGYYDKNIHEGFYNVRFTKIGFLHGDMEDQPIFNTTTLPDTTLMQLPPGVYIEGPVSGVFPDTTYVLIGNTRVEAGDTLIIESGADFLMDGANIDVYGHIFANGIEGDTITFRPLRPFPEEDDYWQGINFHNAPDSSVMQYCFVCSSSSTGIECHDSNPIISHCVIYGNCGPIGGGIHCDNSNPTISYCYIDSNRASGPGNWHAQGGGIHCTNSSPLISHCVINENWADSYNQPKGGAMYLTHSSPTVEYNVFTDNAAWNPTAEGGAIYMDNSDPTIYHCVFKGNFAQEGGCLYLQSAGASIKNTIVDSNYTIDGGAINFGEGNSEVWYCDLFNNIGGDFGGVPPPEMGWKVRTNINGDSCDIYDNIFDDPLFEDPDNGNFQITWDNWPAWDSTRSHCIDAGDPTFPYDPDNTIVDMGAFYFHQGGPVNITLTPYNPPIVIPDSGGTFDFNIELENLTQVQQDFDLWIVVHLPNVGVVDILDMWVTLPSGIIVDRDRTQQVPGTAPAGTYTYEAYVGEHNGWVIEDSDSFTFIKEGSESSGHLGSPLDWPCTGEEFSELISADVIAVPAEFSVNSAYPNPFNPTTVLSFELPVASLVNLKTYDISGRLVTELVNGWRDAGVHEVTFDGSDIASGIYIYRLTAGEFTASGKMVLMK